MMFEEKYQSKLLSLENCPFLCDNLPNRVYYIKLILA